MYGCCRWGLTDAGRTVEPDHTDGVLRRSLLHNRFDDLSRSLQPGSRRRALQALGALGVAGLIDQFSPTGAAAKNKKKKKGKKAKGECPPPRTCPECPNQQPSCAGQPNGTPCGQLRVCKAGACVACGAFGGPCCGTACDPGATCVEGECRTCGGFHQPCCGQICTDGIPCEDGICQLG